MDKSQEKLMEGCVITCLPCTLNKALNYYLDKIQKTANVADEVLVIDEMLNGNYERLAFVFGRLEGIKNLQLQNDKIILSQHNDDIGSGCIGIFSVNIESMDVTMKDGVTTKVSSHKCADSYHKRGIAVIDFNYNNMPTIIKLNFNYGIADPLEITVDTVLFEPPKIDYAKLMLEKMKVSCALGADNINIYFNLCSETAVDTQIVIYRGDIEAELQKLGVFSIEKDMMFKSITGLAYGTYYYTVEQFDKEGKSIAITDKMKIVISPPQNYSRNVICR